MKSIKEKSKEYGFQNPVIHYDADGNTYDDYDKPSNDFEEGANYVLDAIDDVLSHPQKFVSDNISISEAMIVETTKIVEQLKETNK